MPQENPFTLMFGKKPERYITRYENTEQITSTFQANNPLSQIYLIEGVRGSGKTVLMTAVGKELAESERWLVVNLNPMRDLLADLAMRLTDSCRGIRDFFEKGFSISLPGVGMGINGMPAEDPVSIIERLLERLKKKNHKVLITIDEVRHDQNMRIFASQFQIFVRQDYPLFLLMTGLYEDIYAVQNDPALTFLLRSPKLRLKPLSLTQIVYQYQSIFQIEPETARELAQITKGYAFAFQALGALYWEHGKKRALSEILAMLDGMLDDYVYKKIWEGLSQQDKNVVKAIGDADALRVKEICERTGMTSSTFSKYKERLENKGILESPSHGYVSLSLPRFGNVIRNYM